MKRWRCEMKARSDWERGDLFECYAVAPIESEAREAIAQFVESSGGRQAIVDGWLDRAQSTVVEIAVLPVPPFVEGYRLHDPVRDDAREFV